LDYEKAEILFVYVIKKKVKFVVLCPQFDYIKENEMFRTSSTHGRVDNCMQHFCVLKGTLKDNTEMGLKIKGHESVDWVELAQDRFHG
jgi:hypothetical protein